MLDFFDSLSMAEIIYNWVDRKEFLCINSYTFLSVDMAGGINFEFQIKRAPADSIRMCRSGGRFPWLSNMLLWGAVSYTPRRVTL